MKNIILFLFTLFISINCFGEENYIDTSEVRTYIINEVKSAGHLNPGSLRLINEGCDIEVPLFQKRVDLYLKLQKEYNNCTDEVDKMTFIQNNKGNFSTMNVNLNNPDKADDFFADENGIRCIGAFRARCIANVAQYVLDNLEAGLYESLHNIFYRVKMGKKVYWSELIKVGKRWGIPEDKMTRFANESGIYRSKKGLIILR